MSKLRIAAFLIALLSIVSVSFGDPLQDAKNAGNSLGSSFLGSYGSKEGIQQNISNPMTNSNTPMQTLDDSRQFDAQLSCPSSKEFLKVFIQPSATGDLSTVTVGQDTNMDGTTDYNYHVPALVSGVCANGFISCSSGTWLNCVPYKWIVDGTGKAGIQMTGLSDLGGCYCINNSCGSNLVWTNLPLVLKDLGGGIAGALQAFDPQLTVSDVRIDGTLITYYGQKAGDCNSAGGGTGVNNPEQYYSNWPLLDADVETTALAQSADPQSYYSMLSDSYALRQSNLGLKSCTVRKVVATASIGVYDIVSPVGGSGGNIRSCGGKCIEIVLGIEGNNYWCAGCSIFETYYDILVKRPDLIGSATLARVKWDDWIQIWINSQLAWNGPYGNWTSPTAGPPGACELSTSWNKYPDTDFTGYFRSQGIVRTKNRVAVAGCGEGFSIVRLNVNTTCDATATTSDNCAAIESDPGCEFKEETVDGVYTYRDFNPTGLTPVNSCRQFACEVDSTQVCSDWWEKKRVYLCQTAGYDFSDVQKRMGNVVSTTKDNTSNMYYQDLRKNSSGNWIYESVDTALPERDIFKDCEKACKTRKPKADTRVGTSGHTGQYQTNTQGYDFFYKTCVNNSCPLGAGEEIVKDCQCIDEFAEATTVMQSLRMAGRDIICSSGVAKPLQ